MGVLYLDCFAGVSGDMMVGALLDLGLELDTLEHELRKLPISDFELHSSRVDKKGVRATQFQVTLIGESGRSIADVEFREVNPREEVQVGAFDGGNYQESSHPERKLSEILTLIDQSSLSEHVQTAATRIFKRLGEAESIVHGEPLEDVRLHEVGGVDAIIDIVGTLIGIEQLKIDEIYVSHLPMGSGFVRSSHGVLPVPAPATAALLQDVPVYSGPGPGELVTPTGAAIVTSLAKGFGPMPHMRVTGVGYGAGTRQREYPNVLRVFQGELIKPHPRTGMEITPGRDPHPEQHAGSPTEGGYHENPAIIIEANLDDMNPQIFDPLVEHLLEAGALDVILVPVQMKKGRPGVLLQVLAYPTSLDDMLTIIFRESTTIGARSYPVVKHMLQREYHEIEIPYGSVRVKIAHLGKQVVTAAPEFEDCLRLADQHQVPVKEIYALALSAYQRESITDPD